LKKSNCEIYTQFFAALLDNIAGQRPGGKQLLSIRNNKQTTTTSMPYNISAEQYLT